MNRFKNLQLLLTPSLLSLLVSVVASLVIVGSAAAMIGASSDSLKDLVGPTGSIVTSLNNLKPTFDSLFDTIFNSTLLNKGIFIAFWAIVGFITYSIVYSFKSSVDESVTFMKELHYVHAQPSSMRRNMTIRIALLGVSLVLWIIFALMFSWLILPFILNRVYAAIVVGETKLQIIIALLVCMLTMHVAVVLLRFTLLKPRLFNNPAE